MRRNAVCMVSRGAERRSSCTVICTYPVGYIGMSNAICALGSCSVNAVAGDRIFIGQSTIGTSLFELETPYADPHVRCCERCDAKHPPTRFCSWAYAFYMASAAPLRQRGGMDFRTCPHLSRPRGILKSDLMKLTGKNLNKKSLFLEFKTAIPI